MRLIPILLLFMLILPASGQRDMVGVRVDQKYSFTVNFLDGDVFYLDEQETIEINNGGSFDLEIKSLRENDPSEIVYLIIQGDETVEIVDYMDIFGQYVIFTDWNYWNDSNNIGIGKKFATSYNSDSMLFNDSIAFLPQNDTFSYNFDMNTSSSLIHLEFEYNTNYGVLNSQKYTAINQNSSEIFRYYEINRDRSGDLGQIEMVPVKIVPIILSFIAIAIFRRPNRG